MSIIKYYMGDLKFMKMQNGLFLTIFGCFWTYLTAYITYMMYSGKATSISVNGTIVSQSEFNEMLLPKLFMGVFWIVGLITIIQGIRELIKFYIFNKNAIESYGLILENEELKNPNIDDEENEDCIIYNVKMLIMKGNNYEVYTKKDVFTTYPVGSLIELKYYKDNIEILNNINKEDVSDEFIEHIHSNYPEIELINWEDECI